MSTVGHHTVLGGTKPSDPLPPGERAEHELSASQALTAFEVMHALLQEATGLSKGRISVKAVNKVGGKYLLTVVFSDRRDEQSFTVRITRERLTELRDLANEVLK